MICLSVVLGALAVVAALVVVCDRVDSCRPHWWCLFCWLHRWLHE